MDVLEFGSLNIARQRVALGEFCDNPRFMHALVADGGLENAKLFIALAPELKAINSRYNDKGILSFALQKFQDREALGLANRNFVVSFLGFCKIVKKAGLEIGDQDINEISRVFSEVVNKRSIESLLSKPEHGFDMAEYNFSEPLLNYGSINIITQNRSKVLIDAVKENDQHRIELLKIRYGNEAIKKILLENMPEKISKDMADYLSEMEVTTGKLSGGATASELGAGARSRP